PLDYARISSERRMQDFDRHVALEREIARAIHAPEAAGPDLLEQLVIVSQGAPQPPLESRFGDRGRGRQHLKCPGVAHEIFEHLRGGVVAVLGRSEEHTSELQSRSDLVCRLLLEKKK